MLRPMAKQSMETYLVSEATVSELQSPLAVWAFCWWIGYPLGEVRDLNYYKNVFNISNYF